MKRKEGDVQKYCQNEKRQTPHVRVDKWGEYKCMVCGSVNYDDEEKTNRMGL